MTVVEWGVEGEEEVRLWKEEALYAPVRMLEFLGWVSSSGRHGHFMRRSGKRR